MLRAFSPSPLPRLSSGQPTFALHSGHAETPAVRVQTVIQNEPVIPLRQPNAEPRLLSSTTPYPQRLRAVRQTGTAVTKTAVKSELELSDGRVPAVAPVTAVAGSNLHTSGSSLLAGGKALPPVTSPYAHPHMATPACQSPCTSPRTGILAVLPPRGNPHAQMPARASLYASPRVPNPTRKCPLGRPHTQVPARPTPWASSRCHLRAGLPVRKSLRGHPRVPVPAWASPYTSPRTPSPAGKCPRGYPHRATPTCQSPRGCPRMQVPAVKTLCASPRAGIPTRKCPRGTPAVLSPRA
ncbi:hypothetical protein DFH07DRAFT_965970 [Mycena maculata]|uniref:Uncharacterized protein n=1 Tax=Mycena maculata TaxID=230809 RepID=A0AAD7MZ67_9AGAR|nr:hypothetical protein DFH07DRAFT_965970 [Mycena maculata]